MASQSFREVDNLINSSLPKASREIYQDIVTQSVASVVTGIQSAEQAISEATMKMFKKGFTGFTDSAGKRWKADVYARNMIKSTVYRTYREMREKPAEEVGIDTFYYSIKASAREMCAPLQGRIVTKGLARTEAGERILSLLDYGYGEPGGCLGINCGHVLTPFIPGVNIKPELPDDLANLTEEQAIENANVEAKQRALERQIRYNKELLHVAEKLNNKGLIQKYKLKDTTLRSTLDSWIKEHDFLRYDMNRVKRHGTDVEASYKNVVSKAEYQRMTKQFERYKQVLGDKNSPKTVDDLITMKYNNSVEYRRLKDRMFMQQKINSGEWGTKINSEKQAPHIESTAKKGKSYIYDSIDAQSLLDKYMGTGVLEVDRKGRRTNKEIIELDYPIGISVNENTTVETRVFKIHHSKNRTHIVPKERRE